MGVFAKAAGMMRRPEEDDKSPRGPGRSMTTQQRRAMFARIRGGMQVAHWASGRKMKQKEEEAKKKSAKLKVVQKASTPFVVRKVVSRIKSKARRQL